MSHKKAPSKVEKLVVPLNTLRRVVAVILFILKTVVIYTNKLESVPIAPSFSNVSFPNKIQFSFSLVIWKTVMMV